MTTLIRKIQKGFSEAAKQIAASLGFSAERAIGTGAILEQAYMLCEEIDPWAWIMDIFHNDDGSMFAIVASEGRLYRVDLTIQNGEVIAGEWIEVMQEFVPTGRSLKILRGVDGRYRGLLIASTTVLNRVGEIDSTMLHTNLNRRAVESGKYPYIDFFHLGPGFDMGDVDFLALDENVAIASFVFDDSALANAMIRAYEAEPEYWGASISYHPIGTPERMKIGDVEIPVYNDGEYEAITLLPENKAASLFTALRSIQEKNRMNKAVLEALTKLANGDEDLLAQFVAQVDETNRQITERNLIRRDGEETPPENAATDGIAPPDPALQQRGEPGETSAKDQPTEGEEEEEGEGELAPVALDDEAVQAIVGALVGSEAFTAALTAAFAPLQTGLTQLAGEVRTLVDDGKKRVIDVDARLANLEKEDGDKQKVWAADIARKTRQQLAVTYRPRNQDEGEKKPGQLKSSLAEIAAATRAEIKV